MTQRRFTAQEIALVLRHKLEERPIRETMRALRELGHARTQTTIYNLRLKWKDWPPDEAMIAAHLARLKSRVIDPAYVADQRMGETPECRDHRKPERDRIYVFSTRPCLKCGGTFRSEGAHNRICKTCKHTRDWQGGAMA